MKGGGGGELSVKGRGRRIQCESGGGGEFSVKGRQR